MKIWLTGGGGSLGIPLLKVLKSELPDAEIAAPNRSSLNLFDRDSVKNFLAKYKPTHVFHLAACVYGIQGHEEYPHQSLIENTLIDNNVFSALLDNPPHWVYYASTVATYGYPFSDLPLQEVFWNIGQPHESEFGYAMSKRHAYSYLALMKSLYQTKFVYGLTTNLFGHGDRFLEGRGHVIVSLLNKAKAAKTSKSPLEVWGREGTTRDFLSTDTASQIIFELIDKDLGVLNIASGQELAISRIAEALKQNFELDMGYKFTGENQGILKRVSDVTKLKKYSPSAHFIDSWQELTELIKRNSEIS
jgi:GDP-L-fucose synthase